jgi:hypothetical protein
MKKEIGCFAESVSYDILLMLWSCAWSNSVTQIHRFKITAFPRMNGRDEQVEN